MGQKRASPAPAATGNGALAADRSGGRIGKGFTPRPVPAQHARALVAVYDGQKRIGELRDFGGRVQALVDRSGRLVDLGEFPTQADASIALDRSVAAAKSGKRP